LRQGGAALGFGSRSLTHDDARAATTQGRLNVGLSRRCTAATPGKVCLDRSVLSPFLSATLDRDGRRLVPPLPATPIEHHRNVRISGPVGAQRVIEAEVLTAHDNQLASHPYGLLFAGARDAEVEA